MNPIATKPRESIVEMTDVTSGSLRDPEIAIVQNVNWMVSPGDFWVVAGLQGAGKSDFLMMTAGLIPPTRGTLRLFGDELPAFEEGRMQQRLKLGLVFDNGHLLHNLTIAENIALPLRYHSNLDDAELVARLKRLLDLAELGAFAGNTPGSLSHNWQKRAGLARALALQPELLLADNPLSGADPRHADWWLKILGEFSRGHDWMPEKRPTTIVVTADDARLWNGIARQSATLNDQRLEIGTNQK